MSTLNRASSPPYTKPYTALDENSYKEKGTWVWSAHLRMAWSTTLRWFRSSTIVGVCTCGQSLGAGPSQGAQAETKVMGSLM